MSLDKLKLTESNPVRCPDPEMAAQMETYIKEVRKEGDTIGGIITCVAQNVPVGLGEPVFDKLHAELGVVTDKAMVVSAREEASKIGVEIMKKGGNAFDAMVATEMALVVAYPFAGNLGDGDFGALDYREKAPLSGHKDMYLDSLGNVIPGMSTIGATAVGVPGTVAGIIEVHEKFGKLTLEEIFEPVIALAENGIVVTENQEKRLASQRDKFIEINGDILLKMVVMVSTKVKLLKNWRHSFKKKGALLPEEDLAKYEAKWRQPIVFNYKDLRIVSMSPPSSGGVTMNQIFKMIEPHDIGSLGHNSAKTVQLFTEASRRAYADRNYFLGDPDFVDIPLDVILSNSYLKERMSTTKSSDVERGNIEIVESMETTHYSIVDDEGNAVSVTTTLNGAYGSKLYSDELGFFLNNEMDDFSAKPGIPNMFGLIGAEANSIAPEKRMLSSMTPTIVEKDGKLWMVVGTPGGSTIITAVAQTILNSYEFGFSMQDAVNAPRFHHQWLPDMVIFEPEGFEPALKEELKTKGYIINEERTPIIGKVDCHSCFARWQTRRRC
ncbi:Glutathione hydrolase proenzyme [Nymphon striatum]|nr:Glutathione hydrolase proenzyme [Nymphon striatum]